MPENECLLPWDAFVDYVVDITWLSIYAVDVDPTNIFQLPQKPYIRWEIISDFIVRKVSIFWADFAGICVLSNVTTSGGACSSVSKLEYFEETDSRLNQNGRVDRFVSPNPEKFLIYSACMSEQAMCDGLCREGFTGVLVKDQRVNNTGDIILDNMVWCQIEETLNKCFNTSLWDSSTGKVLDWLWKGTDCSFPE